MVTTTKRVKISRRSGEANHPLWLCGSHSTNLRRRHDLSAMCSFFYFNLSQILDDASKVVVRCSCEGFARSANLGHDGIIRQARRDGARCSEAQLQASSSAKPSTTSPRSARVINTKRGVLSSAERSKLFSSPSGTHRVIVPPSGRPPSGASSV